MFYKENLEESIQRYKKLWSREAPDKILVKIDIQKTESPTVLNAMKKSPDYISMVDEWEKGFNLNKNINDDNLPVIYGELGGYIVGGFLGATVKWTDGGAYSEPFLKDIHNYRKHLSFNEDNKYYKMQIDYIKFLGEKSKDRFGFTEMIAVDGLNFLDCIRGSNAYTDIFDYPKEVTNILDFGSDLNIKLIKEQRKEIERYKDGRFNFYGIWTPGETIFISVDAYGHCSAEVFENFGRKYVQRLIDEFDGGWLHVHSDAMRLLPNYVKLKNLVAIGLEDWIKPPRAINFVNEIKDITGDIPLMLNITKEELIQKIENRTLPGNILYWISGVDSSVEANKIAEISYNYKANYKRKFI